MPAQVGRNGRQTFVTPDGNALLGIGWPQMKHERNTDKLQEFGISQQRRATTPLVWAPLTLSNVPKPIIVSWQNWSRDRVANNCSGDRCCRPSCVTPGGRTTLGFAVGMLNHLHSWPHRHWSGLGSPGLAPGLGPRAWLPLFSFS